MSPVDFESILCESFDRQTVGIPAEAAFNILAAHGLVTGDDVFDRTGEQVSVVGQTGSERRAVIEDEFFSVFTLVEGFFESVIFLPQLQDLLLHRRKIDLIGNALEFHFLLLKFITISD